MCRHESAEAAAYQCDVCFILKCLMYGVDAVIDVDILRFAISVAERFSVEVLFEELGFFSIGA